MIKVDSINHPSGHVFITCIPCGNEIISRDQLCYFQEQIYVFLLLRSNSIVFEISVAGNYAVPTMDELQELYIDACQASCAVVSNDEQAQECREKFCPNYSSYLLTGTTIPGSLPSLVSSQQKEVAEFCATWMINLLQELGWRRRIHLNMKECACAASKECLVK